MMITPRRRLICPIGETTMLEHFVIVLVSQKTRGGYLLPGFEHCAFEIVFFPKTSPATSAGASRFEIRTRYTCIDMRSSTINMNYQPQ